MSHPRPFRFGVQTHTAGSFDEWAATAKRAEDLGYDTLFIPDHFGDQLAPLPALTAAAAATTDLRIGTLVLDNDYRHPVVLAKELATVDLLSGGRLEVGLGAGWMTSDYEQSGIPMDPPAVRVDRFEEGLQIIAGLLAGETVTFEGSHYQVAGMPGLPKPAQSPRPPILIGAGAPRMLRIAGKWADIVGINPSIPNGVTDGDAVRTGLADVTDRKLEILKEAAGDRYDDLEINLLNFACIVTDDRDKVAAEFSPLFGIDAEQLLEFPHALVGTVEQLVESIRERRERWDASYIVVQSDAMEPMAPVVAELRGT
jgi:probable F420-dependent oxidoreductase